jgi:wyosine [tRNA(Phe)-imidazoG37] synthetase (radical SAM superfamily)
LRYIYGPVNSRRIGLSLGISLTPYKACSFNCLYCQLGATTNLTVERKEYIPIHEILTELNAWMQNNSEEAKKINYISLSGSGEPTLNSGIGRLISRIKGVTAVPVAVITNASLLHEDAVRKDIALADLIIPTLCAATPKVFWRLSRGHPEVKIEDIIAGLIALRREYRGRIWLEVMLVRGVNDDLRQVRRLKEAIDKINPDKVQLNSPVRTTSEPDVQSVEKPKLERIKEILGEKCEII